MAPDMINGSSFCQLSDPLSRLHHWGGGLVYLFVCLQLPHLLALQYSRLISFIFCFRSRESNFSKESASSGMVLEIRTQALGFLLNSRAPLLPRSLTDRQENTPEHLKMCIHTPINITM